MKLKKYLTALPPLSVFILRGGLATAGIMEIVALRLFIFALPLSPSTYFYYSYAMQMANMAALAAAEVLCGALLVDVYAKTQLGGNR